MCSFLNEKIWMSFDFVGCVEPQNEVCDRRRKILLNHLALKSRKNVLNSFQDNAQVLEKE